MYIEACAITHCGKVRQKNQDSYVAVKSTDNIMEITEDNCKSFSTSTTSLFGVFDGMGGHICGEKASQIASDTAKNMFSNAKLNTKTPSYDSEAESQKLLKNICFKANELICKEMTEVVKGRMGTTASMLLFNDGMFHLCNLGDSPVFLFRGVALKKISYEHTERYNYERIFGKKADPNKKFNLTQHLGILPQEMELDPYCVSGKLGTNDMFLVCSDGLTDMVPEGEILKILSAPFSVKSITEKLVQKALSNGGKDNITVICIKAKENVEEDFSFPPEGLQRNISPNEVIDAVEKNALKKEKSSLGSKALLLIIIALIVGIAFGVVSTLCCIQLLGKNSDDNYNIELPSIVVEAPTDAIATETTTIIPTEEFTVYASTEPITEESTYSQPVTENFSQPDI